MLLIILASGAFAQGNETQYCDQQKPSNCIRVAAPATISSAAGAGMILLNNHYRHATQFAGADCGAQINAAYADLPSEGGIIYQEQPCSFSTPIVFGTNGKFVILQGNGDASTTMTYTATTGTAITLDFGTGLVSSKGIRDITLTGSGPSHSTVGIAVGLIGGNGAEGTTIKDFKLESFGTNITFGDNTWIVKIDHGLIRNGNLNVLMSGCSNCGENMEWDHVTFADMPSISTGQVKLDQGDNRFISCSWDNSPLIVGTASGVPSFVHIISPHFENPNYATIAAWYDFIHINASDGNVVTISDGDFEQDSSASWALSQPEYITQAGGTLSLMNVTMYTPVGPVTQFINTSGHGNISIFNFNDLSGQTARLVGGTSTGGLIQIPGLPLGLPTGFNTVIGPNAGTNVGGQAFDITGSIRAVYNSSVPASGRIISSVPTGTAPFGSGSVTPVQNLFTSPTTYNSSGTQSTGGGILHAVRDQVTLSSGAAIVTLSGASIYTNLSTIVCVGVNKSSNSPFQITPTAINSIHFVGIGTDIIQYYCAGE